MGPRLYPDEPTPPSRQSDQDFSIDPDDNVYYEEEEPAPPRSNFVRPIILGIVALLCAVALWFAFSKSRDTGGGTIPLIRADQGATKMRPDQPGGDAVPDQDKFVFNPNQPGSKVEKLLPQPEQPLPRPMGRVMVDPNAPLPTQEVGEVLTPKAAPAAPIAKAMPPATTSGMLTSPDGAKSVPGIVIPPAGAPPASAKPTAPSAAAGVFRVQIAATKDEATARSEWDRLRKTHGDLLGTLSPTMVKVDLGDKGIFYRIQAGPIADHVKAEKLCTELKKLSIGCIVVSP
jgi:cell division septation protein DedD